MMGSLGMLGVLGASVVIVIILAAIAGGNGGSPLVLKEFKLNGNDEEFLIIRGRAAGILSWVLSLCGIDPVTSLICTRQAARFETSAIRYGKETKNISLAAVSCVASGIKKPFPLLVLGVLFAVGSIIGAIATNSFVFFCVGLVIGAVFLVLYGLNKTMRFSIYTGGDRPIASITIKKSVIEGQSIDPVKYEAAAGTLNKAVLNARKQTVAVKMAQ
jgi:hypothetical protein